ncbi:LIM and SH3 domain protein 1-like isoform X1 [Hypomesus transpacificus]|uniref:LIM and SH3 domain protein 1-like isoform X1 n=1 Tax=Hypomesus transpacificus TaxID=137520 RepID=UPI001F07DF8D|nr:LIM and SH3 domain protein 1-like isoform X1 [Hypomesus transpacificus]
MNPQCARCGKIVYPTEKVNCLDKNWHKGCFHCEVCKMTLNMKNYKGYDKTPYCNAHYPKTSFTIVADTPENLRLKHQSELQSQVKYKRDFEESKGRGFSIVSDTPELQRLRRTQEQISNAKYHEDFERERGRGYTPVMEDVGMDRLQRSNHMMMEAGYKGVHPQVVEMDRRPGIIVDMKVWRTDPGSIFDFDPVEDNIQSKSLRRMSERASRLSRQVSQQSLQSQPASLSSLASEPWDHSLSVCSGTSTPAPVLPGAYHQSVPQQQQGYGYMHQTSMSSVRSIQSPPHSTTMRVYRALYDYAAQDHDEVSFRDGDIIVNAQSIDEGWMYGTVQRTGKSGMLPANYVEGFN